MNNPLIGLLIADLCAYAKCVNFKVNEQILDYVLMLSLYLNVNGLFWRPGRES